MKLNEYELYELYDDMLDDFYGQIHICGYEYTTSDTLKKVDPIAYNCMFNDWLDAELNAEVFFEKNGEYYTEDVCECCLSVGYIEVTHDDNCEYIEACDECNAFTEGSMCDATNADSNARKRAIIDGYKLNKCGKII